jgi:hypothetical protein
MSSPFPPPAGRIRRVGSFEELRFAPLADGVQALCWPRTPSGDFSEVVRLLGPGEGIVVLDETRLAALRPSAAGREAVRFLLEDLRMLEDLGLSPELNCIHGYARDERSAPVRTDVFSFHVDRAPVETDTWLCTYHGPASEGLCHEDARRLVEDPAVRSRLLERFGGRDDEAFAAWLREHSYDLHFEAKPGALPFSFGVGSLWRIATQWPGSPVPPCVHRAPPWHTGQPPRLLLIS